MEMFLFFKNITFNPRPYTITKQKADIIKIIPKIV